MLQRSSLLQRGEEALCTSIILPVDLAGEGAAATRGWGVLHLPVPGCATGTRGAQGRLHPWGFLASAWVLGTAKS